MRPHKSKAWLPGHLSHHPNIESIDPLDQCNVSTKAANLFVSTCSIHFAASCTLCLLRLAIIARRQSSKRSGSQCLQAEGLMHHTWASTRDIGVYRIDRMPGDKCSRVASAEPNV